MRVKICCIASPDEARLAVAQGADAVGLVGPMPSGPGVIDACTARAVARCAPPPIATVLLSSAVTGEALVTAAEQVGASVLQIVDRPRPDAMALLRRRLPALKLVRVVHVEGEDAIAEARAAAREADALLLDSGRPKAQVRELGGTGRIHDWRLSRRIVEAVPVPVFLAGGLHAGNVAEAIAAVRPWAVDVCSGVRSDGALDPARLAAFMAAVTEAGEAA